MDDAKSHDLLTEIMEQLLTLGRNQAEMRVSLHVLKGLASIQMSPDDPIEGAKMLRTLEKQVAESDSNLGELREVSDLVERLKHWQQTGGGKHEA
jgi:hypothetical protein